jgi:hypothetical protein
MLVTMPRRIRAVMLLAPALLVASGCEKLKQPVSKEGELTCRRMASEERTDFMAKKIYDDCIATVDADLAVERKQEHERVAAEELAANKEKKKRADAWGKRLAWCPSIRASYVEAETARAATVKAYSEANEAFGRDVARAETIAYKQALEKIETIQKRIVSFDDVIYPNGWGEIIPYMLNIYMKCDPSDFKD